MNVFVTGHTSGLGKAIYDTCISYDYHTVGLSRTNGFDLAKNLENFVQRDYWDVLVNNNAYYSGHRQIYYTNYLKKIKIEIV